ncbi:MRPL44 54S ribosomal protein L44 [Candida maltosa Xu316]
MITKYFANVVVRFNPFLPAGKSARLFLARVPAAAKVDCKVLTKPTDEQEIQVTFKDKHVMKVNPSAMTLEDLSEYFDVHSRKLSIKESIND